MPASWLIPGLLTRRRFYAMTELAGILIFALVKEMVDSQYGLTNSIGSPSDTDQEPYVD